MEPMRNTFVVAAESVIDAASAVDLHASGAVSGTQMQQALTTRDTLNRMVEDDREHDIAAIVGELLFTVQACRIQAQGGASTGKCQGQLVTARDRAMDALGKHKSNGGWVNGPPSR